MHYFQKTPELTNPKPLLLSTTTVKLNAHLQVTHTLSLYLSTITMNLGARFSLCLKTRTMIPLLWH